MSGLIRCFRMKLLNKDRVWASRLACFSLGFEKKLKKCLQLLEKRYIIYLALQSNTSAFSSVGRAPDS